MSEIFIEGTINKIKFQNEQNGYCVIDAETADGQLTVVGCAPFAVSGGHFTATGEFTFHSSYGEQFTAKTLEVEMPGGGKGDVLSFLGGGALSGIGKVTAKRLCDEFGDEVLTMIEKRDERLLRVKGLTRDKLRVVSDEYARLAGVAKLIAELSAYGLSAQTAAVLYRKFGPNAAAVFRGDPYILCTDEEIELEFEPTDEIAKKMQIGGDDRRRLRAALEYVLYYNRRNGHTFAPRSALVRASAFLTEAGQQQLEECLDALIDDRHLISRDIFGVDAVFLPRYFTYEAEISNMLHRLDSLKPPREPKLDTMIKKAEKARGISFAQLQRKAIKDCVENAVFVLTGGPGTGKTTALCGIIAVFDELELKICLCAPTGRAAKRMNEITGKEASTIHRLLGTKHGSGSVPIFAHDENNPIDCDVLIVDETSMLDVQLAYYLLRAVKAGCRVVFVGDSKQLPPVGAGNVLKDMLQSDMFSSVELNEIFRQAGDSLIVVNAHMILSGEPPELDSREGDFFFLERPGKPETAATLTDLVAHRLPKNLGYDPFEEVQVICPTRKGEVGSDELNVMLQRALNPAAPDKAEFVNRGRTFRAGDKIMQIRNNYDLQYIRKDTGELSTGIFNGDIGRIVRIDRYSETAEVNFDERTVQYPFEFFVDIELAYAITVHKAQGSEFRAVVMPVWFNSDKLQTRNLLYTAITRARETMVLTGSRDAILKMSANTRENKRYCALRAFLEEGYS